MNILCDSGTFALFNQRVLSAMLPYRILQELFSQSSAPLSNIPSIRESPELYGPFWVPTSLIFFMFVVSSTASYISDAVRKTLLGFLSQQD